MRRRNEKERRAGTWALERVTAVYAAVMCTAGVVLPGLNGYTAAGRSAFFFCAGASLCYLAALVLTAAEVWLTGGGKLRVLLAPLARPTGSRIFFLLYAAWASLSALCSSYDGVWLGLGRYEGLLFIWICVAVYWAVSAYGRWDGRLLALLGAVLLAFGAWAGRRERFSLPGPEQRPRRLWLAMLVLAVLGTGLLYLLPVSGGTLGEVHQILRGTVDPSFGSGRVRIWREVLRLIGEAPLLGGGPDTLAARMTFTFTRYSQETGTAIEAMVDAAHNDFLNIAVNLGLPALGFYVAGLACWLRNVLRRRPPAAEVILPGIAAYLVQICLTVSTSGVILLYWILLALCERDINSSNCKEEKLK